jgi:hypothetical protein
MSEDNSYENIHQNAYKEMLITAIECKVLQACKLIKEAKPNKGVKFEIVVSKDDTKMIMDQEEEKIGPDTDKPSVEDYQLDFNHSLNTITIKIEDLKAQALNVARNVLRHIIRESRCYDEISSQEENILIDLMLNYIAIEKDENLTRTGIRILFDGDNLANTNDKNKDCTTFLNAVLQVLNPAHMAKEFSQSVNKSKNSEDFDTSKMKALKRRVLVKHYCPFLAIVKDSKSKQEYLLNPNINKEVVNQITQLCSIQRLIYAYVNLNTSLLALIKSKITELDGLVICKQLRLLTELVEHPVTRFLNHSNLGNK